MVRSEERGIYTPSENLTVQISSEVATQISGLPTLTENTVHKESEVSACKSVSELPANVGTSDVRSKPNSQHCRCRDSWLGLGQCRNSRRTSGLPTVGTPGERRDFRRAQTVSSQKNHQCWDCWLGSGLLTIGTSDTRRDFRLSGVPTHVGTSDCREFRHTLGLPTSTVTAQAVTESQHFRQES